MSTAALTTAYRPQRFADVAGQETVKSVLSRAAKEDKVAPAYLFSGTRGVGKTTIARIFAKALNCKNAPTNEPCNECEHCKKITQGMHVDVVEIDGASNRGIDDARRLRESIGYAAMEGRYKVFIIDEAHMLTRDAFNALLKTLEEPPKGVTFILATTESHKFPITIISRCQHYTFKMLTEQELVDHLTKILELEKREYDPAAVRLIARRAAGSVRDSMSLLGQVLALGNDRLEVADVRSILGLAGQELFFSVMEAMKNQDVVALSQVIRDILEQGVDIGFFLRELGNTWRNLFMLKQAGEQALPLLNLPEAEAQQWLALAPQFALSHVHACWQLTLEGQRRVLNSLEPAMALELLLLNLAFLPKLISTETLSRGTGTPQQAAGQRPAPQQSAPTTAPQAPTQMTPQAAPQMRQQVEPQQAPVQQSAPSQAQPPHRQQAQRQQPPHRQEPPHRQQQQRPQMQNSMQPSMPPMDIPPAELPPELGGANHSMSSPPPDLPPSGGGDGSSNNQPSDLTRWSEFLESCQKQDETGGKSLQYLAKATGKRVGDTLQITAAGRTQYDMLNDKDIIARLTRKANEWYGTKTVTLIEPATEARSYHELKEEIESDPAALLLKEELGAELLTFKHKDDPSRK
ncbi:DNA polymerase III subunit gamma/tau [Halodesulfovibrio marinisediminis]|uniref:DNA polymerase III subunit gamma/tau n=1 Tax=Halodesulfovibrio marinisediminis DSM 17456 TaxID=1121457 RepID=A0A1N6EYZ3_9BACT|nr:DNA polymerase III subunit gamma/tau [Halodesulfovibrio marinisediminis]SIN88173.1 DNA polymerase III, tau subunit [Halodesulfovibrio marinisediminis DSM 17456]